MKKSTLFVLLFCISATLFAQNNSIDFKGWKQTQTEHFTFIYEDAQREATEGYVKIADNAWNKIAKIYSLPRDNFRIYVTGRTNTVNAFTYNSPVEIVMFTNPLNLIDFTFRANWQELFFTHELIHAANFTFEDRSKTLNYIFGPFGTSLDFMFVDGWALEGLTTVLETELTDGGRGRSPFFELEYKAITLDNGFLPYENIGLEKEPPYGQSYVIGYLIMRSIADRYGLQALADIERNRETGGDWAKAVQLVTGETPQDIYRDVRIALAKKFNSERSIPEGKIISPRTLGTCYYKPAIVLDDGSLITIRSTQTSESAVVKLDPSAKKGSNYIQDQNLEKDLNTLLSETILFSSYFPDTLSVTADKNENIYAISVSQRNDKAPGVELTLDLVKWTKENGLERLTSGVSLFQPSVSRNGNLLVASEQKGMQMRLVQVDIQSGEIKSLLENTDKSYIYSAVNNDGTKVAFLETDNTRARVGFIDVNNPSKITYVANNGEQVFDPGYLSWTQENTLTYACNYRGRLEVFEAITTDDGNWSYKPVVSDPIGVTWAYKNNVGIFYTSKASSGDVIKIKPVEEWEKVPEFDGPSPAGEKMCFGHLESDYPDFKPYKVLAEVEVPEKSAEEKKAEREAELKLVKEGKPIPVHGKTVKHRSEENKKKAEESNAAITEIIDEKPFIPLPQPMAFIPFVNLNFNEFTDESCLGFGGAFIAITPRLQMSSGFLLSDFFYYPKLKNFDAELFLLAPIFNSELDLILTHSCKFVEKTFKEVNNLQVGFQKPFIHRYFHRNEIDLSLVTSASFSYNRFSPSNTSISYTGYTISSGIYSQLGLEAYYNLEKPKNSDVSFGLTGLGVAYYDCQMQKLFAGFEGDFSYKINKDILATAFTVTGRYTPFPTNITPTYSAVKFGGTPLDCSSAAYIVPRLEFITNKMLLGVLDESIYGELIAQYDENNNFKLLNECALGMEFAYTQSKIKLAVGGSFIFGTDEISPFNLYLSIKYGWFRN